MRAGEMEKMVSVATFSAFRGCRTIVPRVFVSLFFFLWRGFIYSKGAREPQSTTPEGRGGGWGRLIIDSIRIAVEAARADHGILVEQVFEGVARRRTRCGSCCRASCN
jgi:hypothetical protein